MKTFFYKLGIRELTINKHGLEGPVITISNKKNHAKDRIWESPGLTITEVGYLTFQRVVGSNQIIIWIKIYSITDFVSKTIALKTLC